MWHAPAAGGSHTCVVMDAAHGSGVSVLGPQRLRPIRRQSRGGRRWMWWDLGGLSTTLDTLKIGTENYLDRVLDEALRSAQRRRLL